MKKGWKDCLYNVWALLINLLLAYAAFMICRLVFLWENASLFQDMTFGHLMELCRGGLYFDTSAILYANALIILLTLFPLHWKETPKYHRVVRGIYVGINTLCVAVNLMDTVYFQYTNRRTTASVFSQFANEDNLGRIIGMEFLHHWYFVVLTALVGFGLYKLYRLPRPDVRRTPIAYYITYIIALAAGVPFTVFGMRGGMTRQTRPITISNANQYVNRPIETGIVLNTPFSLLRTLGKKPFVIPQYFTNRQEMTAAFNPVHMPADSTHFTPKNVVVLILESFGKEYFGSLNPTLEGGHYKGYTPFLDSLIRKSLVFDYSFANGRTSIDGMPSSLSSIPMFVEKFLLTPAALNNLTSVAGELRKKGYYTAFFHGAANGSMGFQAFSRSAGYQDYFGRTEYGNDKDFDGNWAIWDEEFLQFFAQKMATFHQPFSTGIFTASSHHPYNIPERYKNIYPEGSLPIHKCIRYSDHALQRFFETAKKAPWFRNTIFVLTADHTNQTEHPEYQTEAGIHSIPIIFYTPDGSLAGERKGISQQIDIMPTVLGYLGYDKPYVAFGCDLLHTPDEETYAVNYLDGIYQFFKGDYMIQFDGEKTIAVYAFKTDVLLKHNLVGKVPQQAAMERELKAMIQQYMERMNHNQMVITPEGLNNQPF